MENPGQSDQPSQPLYSPDYQGAGFIDMLLVLSKHLKWVILIPSVVVISSAVFVLFQDPVYVATAKILQTYGNPSSDLAGIAAQFGVSISRPQSADISSSDIYPEIIKSRTLAKGLLEKKFDTEKYGKGVSLLSILTHGGKNPKMAMDILMKQATQSLGNMIDIKKDRQSSVFMLTAEGFEPEFAAQLASAVIQELDKLQRQFKSKRVREKKTFIEDRIADVQIELEEAEETLKDFRDRNRKIGNSPALLLEQERLARDVDVQKGIYITLKQQHELAKIEEVQEAMLVQVLDPPEAPLTRDRPRRKSTILLSMIIGTVFGIGMAFVKEYFEKGDEEDEAKMAKVKHLAVQNVKELLTFRSAKLRS